MEFESDIHISKYDTNIEVAQKLIYARYQSEVMGLKLSHDFYTADDLEEIASHLMAFVKASRAREKRNDE